MVKTISDYIAKVEKRKRKTAAEKEYTQHLNYTENKSYSENKKQYDSARKKLGLQEDDVLTKRKYDAYVGNPDTGDKGIATRYEEYLQSKKDQKQAQKQTKKEAAPKKGGFSFSNLVDGLKDIKESKYGQAVEKTVETLYNSSPKTKAMVKAGKLGVETEDRFIAAPTRNLVNNDNKFQPKKDITDAWKNKRRTSGEEIIKNSPLDTHSKIGNKILGFGAEAVIDPANLVGAGIGGKMLRTASKVAKASKGVKAAEKVSNAVEKATIDVSQYPKNYEGLHLIKDDYPSEVKVALQKANEGIKSKANQLQLPAPKNRQAISDMVKAMEDEGYSGKKVNNPLSQEQYDEVDQLIQAKRQDIEAAPINQKGTLEGIEKLQKELEARHSQKIETSIQQQKEELDQIRDIERMEFENIPYVKGHKEFTERKLVESIGKEVEYEGHVKMAEEYKQIKQAAESKNGRIEIPAGTDQRKEWIERLPNGSVAAQGKGTIDIYTLADNLGFNSVDEFVDYYARAYESHKIVKGGSKKFVGDLSETPEEAVESLWEMSPQNYRYKDNVKALEDMRKPVEQIDPVRNDLIELAKNTKDFNEFRNTVASSDVLENEFSKLKTEAPGVKAEESLFSVMKRLKSENYNSLPVTDKVRLRGEAAPLQAEISPLKAIEEETAKLPHQLEQDEQIKNIINALNSTPEVKPSKVNVKDFATSKAMKIEDRVASNKKAAATDQFNQLFDNLKKAGRSIDEFSKPQLQKIFETGEIPKLEKVKPNTEAKPKPELEKVKPKKEKVATENIEAAPKGLDPETAPLHKMTKQEQKLAEAQPMPEGFDSIGHIEEQLSRNAKEVKKPFKERFKDLVNRFYYIGVDDKYGIARTDKAAGKNVDDFDSAVAQAHRSAGSGEIARQSLEDGVYNTDGEKIGKSFKEILQGSKNPDKLEEYMVARGILDYDAKGMIAIKTDGISQSDIANDVISKLEKEFPGIKKEAEDVYKFIDQQQQILKDGGLINQAQIDQMKKDNPNYIGFNRVIDDEGPENFVTGKDGLRKRVANVGKPINKRTGSERQIISPFETLVKRQYVYTNISERNKAGAAVLRNLRALGEDNIFGSIIKEEKDAMYKLLRDADDIANESEETLAKSLNDMFSKQEGKNNLIYVYENGNKYTIQIKDKLLFDSMMAMDTKALPVWLQAVNLPVRMLRAGVTLSPDFGLRNFFRDQLTTGIVSKNNYIPFVDSASGMIELLKGKNSKFNAAFTKNGGDMSMLQNIDRKDIIKSYQDLRGKPAFQKFKEAAKDPKKLIDGIMTPFRKAGEISERATRLGHMKKAVKKGKSIEQATYEARATMDFNRAGAWGRQFNQGVAFFNAAVQGMDVLGRAMVKNPIRTSSKIGMYVVAPTVALYQMNKDQQWYKDLKQDDKDKNWFIKLPGKDGEILKFPKPFEVGIMFGAGVERALDKGEDSFEGFPKQVYDAITPEMWPTVLKPWLEVMTDYNFFTDSSIESMGEKDMAAEDRKTAYNSQIAGQVSKGLSKLNPNNEISPKDIDHLVRGYTGTLGTYFNEGVDMIAEAVDNDKIPDKPSRGAQTLPLVKSFVQRNLEGNNKPTDDFYNLYEKLHKLSNKEDFKYQQQKKNIDRVFREITKLQTEKKSILNNNDMNGKKKTEEIIKLNEEITKMSRKANKENKIR